jgi:endonuclease III
VHSVAPAIEQVASRLARIYPSTRHHNKRDPFWELVFIVLSAQTAERAYLATYRTLRKRFPRRADLAAARSSAIASAIRDGGLARKKARQLSAIARRFGALGAGHRLRDLDDIDLERALESLPGVAQKTARCVAMYALGRSVFPVDAHVARVMRRLGYTEATRVTPAVGDALQRMVPSSLRARLHVDLLSHGRAICRERRPLCGDCPLVDLCPSAGRVAA